MFSNDNFIDKDVLQLLIWNEIPLSKFMDFSIVHCSSDFFTTTAPLKPNNINVHGTAFAGSIYTLAILSAWGYIKGLSHALLIANQNDSSHVVSHAEIRYIKPIDYDMTCHINFDQGIIDNIKQLNTRHSKTRCCINANIYAFPAQLSDKNKEFLLSTKEQDFDQEFLCARTDIEIYIKIF